VSPRTKTNLATTNKLDRKERKGRLLQKIEKDLYSVGTEKTIDNKLH
jgi:hypothetical protein